MYKNTLLNNLKIRANFLRECTEAKLNVQQTKQIQHNANSHKSPKLWAQKRPQRWFCIYLFYPMNKVFFLDKFSRVIILRWPWMEYLWRKTLCWYGNQCNTANVKIFYTTIKIIIDNGKGWIRLGYLSRCGSKTLPL